MSELKQKFVDLKNGKLDQYKGFHYVNGNANGVLKKELEKYGISNSIKFNTDILTLGDNLILDQNKVNDFISDFNLHANCKIIIKKNNYVLVNDNVPSIYAKELNDKVTGKDIYKYVDIDKTIKQCKKFFNIIQIDDDCFIKDSILTNKKDKTDFYYKLSWNTFDQDIEKYKYLKYLLTSISNIKDKDLNELDDHIGDTFMSEDYTDYLSRSAPFLYIKGKLIFSNYDQLHAELLKEHFSDEELENLYINMNDPKSDPFASGQIVGGIAIIDKNTCINCNIDDVIHELKKVLKKVYVTEDRVYMTRVAAIKKEDR